MSVIQKTVKKQVCLNQVALLLQKIRNKFAKIILKYKKHRGKWIDDINLNYYDVYFIKCHLEEIY